MINAWKTVLGISPATDNDPVFKSRSLFITLGGETHPY
jgi:hypothetical protein